MLRRFTVAFDYAHKKMYLAPNADFGKPYTFDRSGLWLLADGDALKVADVAGDSAAARAGMRNNDRIVSIEGHAVKQRTLSEWRERLRNLPAGTKLEVTFLRNGKQRDAELVPARAAICGNVARRRLGAVLGFVADRAQPTAPQRSICHSGHLPDVSRLCK